MDNVIYPQYKVFGTDIDISERDFVEGRWIDITEKLKFLANFMPEAKKVELLIIGWLEIKPAYRIRIRGEYNDNKR